MAKDFLDQVDTELAKNEKMNGEIVEMKSQMEHERETREDLRKRFQEINKIRQDREKVCLISRKSTKSDKIGKHAFIVQVNLN